MQVNGGEVREIQVNLDPAPARGAGPAAQPRSPTSSPLDNLDVPGRQGRAARARPSSLRTKGEFQAAAEIENVILRSTGGSTVRVKDVGTVVDGYKERDVDDAPERRRRGVVLGPQAVRRQHGRDCQRKIDAALREGWRPTFPHLQISPVHDDADCIKSRTSSDVREHIIFGGIMAVLVIFVFMRDWRSTLISALALPTSVIATFFFMYVVGFTINMMTLMALSLVIGILIDDAVVVRENIYRHMEHGRRPDDGGPQRHRRRSASP